MCGKYTFFPCKNHVRHTFENFSVCLNTWVKGIFKYTVYTRKKKQVGTVKTNTDEKQRVRSLGFAERNHGNLILDTHLSCRRGLVKSPAFLLARSLHFYRLVEKKLYSSFSLQKSAETSLQQQNKSKMVKSRHLVK